MARQYFRNVRATIGLGSSKIELEGLRFRFEVVKNQITSRLHNAIKLEIFNLKASTRQKIRLRGTQVRLDVGYGETLVKVFEGQLRRAFSVHEETEWITTIYANENWKETSERTIDQTFRAGSDAETVLRDVAAHFSDEVADGLVLEDVKDLPKLLGSLSTTGSVAAVLDGLIETYGLSSWGWVDGRLEITGPLPDFDEEIVKISAGTGMVGSPIVTDLGIKVVTLLNPSLRVNRKIRIESVGAGLQIGSIEIREEVPQLHEGEYRIGEIVHTGDNFGNDWVSKIQTHVIEGTV